MGDISTVYNIQYAFEPREHGFKAISPLSIVCVKIKRVYVWEREWEREREREREIGRTRNRLKIVFDGRQISCTSIWILASLFLSSFSVAGYRVRFKRVGGHRGACMRVRKHDRVVVALQGDNHWSLNESVQRMDSISWICEREKEWVSEWEREREREREWVGRGGKGLGREKVELGGFRIPGAYGMGITRGGCYKRRQRRSYRYTIITLLTNVCCPTVIKLFVFACKIYYYCHKYMRRWKRTKGKKKVKSYYKNGACI